MWSVQPLARLVFGAGALWLLGVGIWGKMHGRRDGLRPLIMRACVRLYIMSAARMIAANKIALKARKFEFASCNHSRLMMISIHAQS